MDTVLAIDTVGELGIVFCLSETGDVTDLLPDVLDLLRVVCFAIVWLLMKKLAMCILWHCFYENENSVYEEVSEDRKMVSLT